MYQKCHLFFYIPIIPILLTNKIIVKKKNTIFKKYKKNKWANKYKKKKKKKVFGIKK